MLINNLVFKSAPKEYYSDKFRIVLDSHLHLFQNSNMHSIITIDKGKAYVWEGDFYGLLDDLKIDRKLHWLTMRLNNIVSQFNFDIDISFLKIPKEDEVNKIYNLYRTKT